MVNFTFVPHKGARPERSELVKSHVMREWQRRRREGKQRKTITPSLSATPLSAAPFYQNLKSVVAEGGLLEPSRPDSLPLSTPPFFNPPTPSLSAAPFCQNLESVVAEGGLLEPSRPDSLPLSTPPFFNPPTPDVACPGRDGALGPCVSPKAIMLSGGYLKASNNTPLDDVYFEDDDSFYEGLNWQVDLEISSNDSHRDGDQTKVVLLRQPDYLYPIFLSNIGRSNEKWLSRRMYERVVGFSYHYTSTLYIEKAGHLAANSMDYWQRRLPLDFKLFLSSALFYGVQGDVIQGHPVNEHCYIKGKFLRLINKALEDPRTAISDSTLMSIVSMCICENIRGTNVVTIHLQGLRHMINLRGGINNLPTDQGQYISEMALMQDMMHATCSNVSPIMFDVYPPILRDMRESGIEHWYPQSPLGVVIDTAFLCPSLELQSSSEILKDAFDAFEMLSIEAFDTETGPDQADVFKLRRDKIYGQLAQCEKEMTEELPYTIQEKAEGAIRIAARIHYRAVVLKVQHEDVLNTEDVTRLYAIMRKIEPGFWKVAYHVYLWLALTGGAASCRHPLLRSYFMSEIIRLGLSIGLSDWLSFRQTMGNFLWLQHHLRKGKSPPRIQIR